MDVNWDESFLRFAWNSLCESAYFRHFHGELKLHDEAKAVLDSLPPGWGE